MDIKAFAARFWRDAAAQNRDALRAYFLPDAAIRWHCTNECFTVEEYLTANCDYPDSWQGNVERADVCGSGAVTVARVWSERVCVYAVSFFTFENGKIKALDEYWTDSGPAPEWRRELKLGESIRPCVPPGGQSE